MKHVIFLLLFSTCCWQLGQLRELARPTETTFAKPVDLELVREDVGRPTHGLMNQLERQALVNRTREMFFHGFDKYMEYAFPHEELCPLSCRGRGRKAVGVPSRGDLDDVFAGYPLTLIDSLDTLALMGAYDRFARALDLVRSSLASFDFDAVVSVFETTIRTLGGLLSAHQLAVRAQQRGFLVSSSSFSSSSSASSSAAVNQTPFVYSGFLVDLARDLGDRLLPAFNTATGIPWSRINLRSGQVPSSERRGKSRQCIAGAGTLALEFGLLSALTGDPRYWKAVRRCADGLFELRSTLDLFGGHLRPSDGRWLDDHASIGAGADSFYEYLLKAHVLSGDRDLLTMFNRAYTAVEKHLRAPNGGWYADVRRTDGVVVRRRTQALAAFWPALQVMAGDVHDAEQTFDHFLALWRTFGFLPESVTLVAGPQNSLVPRLAGSSYPLRPELFESALALFQATDDHEYLFIGRELLAALERARVPCGFAAVADVNRARLEDRLDSYFFAETLKYAYLLFVSPEPHPLLDTWDDVLLTTEGHPVLLNSDSVRRWRVRLDQQAREAAEPQPAHRGQSNESEQRLCECGCGHRVHRHQDPKSISDPGLLAQSFTELEGPSSSNRSSHWHTACPAGEAARDDSAAISFSIMAAVAANQSVDWHWSKRRVWRRMRRRMNRQIHFSHIVAESSPPDQRRLQQEQQQQRQAVLDPVTFPANPTDVDRSMEVVLKFVPTGYLSSLHFESYNRSIWRAPVVVAEFGIRPSPASRVCGPLVFAGTLCFEHDALQVTSRPLCPAAWATGERPFVVSDRGSCLFVDKARLTAARPLFGRVAVIINNVAHSLDQLFVMSDGAGTTAGVRPGETLPCSIMIPRIPLEVRRSATRACLFTSNERSFQVQAQFPDDSVPGSVDEHQLLALISNVQDQLGGVLASLDSGITVKVKL